VSRRFEAAALNVGAALRLVACGTAVERGMVSAGLIEGLKAVGHDVGEIEMTSGLQGIGRIQLPDGRTGWAGGTDPRREGIGLGD